MIVEAVVAVARHVAAVMVELVRRLLVAQMASVTVDDYWQRLIVVAAALMTSAVD